MKVNKPVSLLALLLVMNMQAQDLKILVDSKGKIGYADQTGNVVIKCQYESAQPFSDGTAIVTKSGKSGIINAEGKILLPLKYTQISSWNNDLYLIKEDKKMGLADHQGVIVLPVGYSHISKPNCYGKALIALGGKPVKNNKKTYMTGAKYGIIDAQGNILVAPKHKGLYEFSYDPNGTYPYFEGRRLEYSYHNVEDTLVTDCSYLGFNSSGFSIYNAGIIDGNGKELLKAGLYYFVMQPQNGMVRYYNEKKQKTICGYHDLETNKGFEVATFNNAINNLKFWSHGDFVGNVAPVNGETWSFIDKNGNVLRQGYKWLRHSPITNLWAAKTTNDTWDVFTELNEDVKSLSGYSDIVFPAHYDDKKIFAVMKDGKYGYVTNSGSIAIPFEYENALANSFDMIAVKKDGKWGLLSSEGKIIIPIKYEGLLLPIERDTKHFFAMKSDSLYYHVDAISGKVSPTGYMTVTNFIDGIAHVTPKGLKINDTPVTRAQIYAPNTSKDVIDALDMTMYQNHFGYLMNTNDILLIDYPVTPLYKNAVIKKLKELGNHIPSESEKKNIILEVTRENRSYYLKSTLSEDEWNY